MTEQNGIDILCDAAGSDLLSSFFLSSDQQQQQPQQQEVNNQSVQEGAGVSGPGSGSGSGSGQQEPDKIQKNGQGGGINSSSTQAATAPAGTSSGTTASSPSNKASQPNGKRVRLSNDDNASQASTSSHVCQICKRVYERKERIEEDEGAVKARHPTPNNTNKTFTTHAGPIISRGIFDPCSRCPKRFNRADLLTRHETTHDRDNGGKGRAFIRRSDRAAEACLKCAASKAKCDDSKPCGRCRAKNLICQTPSRKTHQYQTSSEAGAASAASPSECSTIASTMLEQNGGGEGMGIQTPALHNKLVVMDTPYIQGHPTPHENTMGGNAAYLTEALAQPSSIFDGIADDMAHFNPMHTFFQDMDFTSWDLNFDNFTIPQLEPHGPSPQSSTTNTSKPSSRMRDPSRGHAAFKRSPWLWEPKTENHQKERAGLDLNEEKIANSPAFDRHSGHSPLSRLKMTASTRDRLFAMVITEHKGDRKALSFPSLELLTYLLQAHFVQADHLPDAWIHVASFEPSEILPELLAAVISCGSMFIAQPSIWQFGLALQEVVRLALASMFESSNTYTRDLQCLQAFMLTLDVGLWSGFKRKMEIAESFVQPVMTMLRRAGTFSAPPDNPSLLPSMSDHVDVLEAKWHKFIKRESYKRLVIHLFFHDIQSSISLQKNPLMSYTELCFSLPAARDLWKARNADEWRAIYLAKKPLAAEEVSNMPRVSDVMHCVSILDEYEEHVDVELCYTALLHGYWGQIAAYREAVRFYHDPFTLGPGSGRAGAMSLLMGRRQSTSNVTHRLWLKTQHQELYRDLGEFSSAIEGNVGTPRGVNGGHHHGHGGHGGHGHGHGLGSIGLGNLGMSGMGGMGGGRSSNSASHHLGNKRYPHLTILAELFKMILHVSPDELQRFAGKAGEEEARRAALSLEVNWAKSNEAKFAVWHAGQVFRAARALPPASLRGFNAISVYFASLTLWVFGLLNGGGGGTTGNWNVHGEDGRLGLPGMGYHGGNGRGGQDYPGAGFDNGNGGPYVILDGPETRDTKAFIQLDRGVPALSAVAASQGVDVGSPDDPFMAAGLGSATSVGPHHLHGSSSIYGGSGSVFGGSSGGGAGGVGNMAAPPPITVNPNPAGAAAPGYTSGPPPPLVDGGMGVHGNPEPLSNPSMILSIARNLFRDNYPVRTEPLPPLVESLGNLLRDLGSGAAGRPSRAVSEDPVDVGVGLGAR
ncbi:Nicotinate catabolism cluster-specific transcription factor [Zalerion maritima]|uniref:Nicotinate catabolism cluster-specific transcription factor n=1 Tax=Zalerion maritima TaxID=339359 RepID=A0AAD5RWB0_9PEZI|nr:Nicotinate catabolism cluster-specific transcription factor [Zalerion maritima]